MLADDEDPSGPHTPSMLMQTLRFLMLRALPRRLVPFLTAVELVLLIRRMRRRAPEPTPPRRLVTADGRQLPPR
jgi:hypothetical protein